MQHYGDVHRVKPSKELYFNDLQAMFEGLYNHPSIIQWELFNEGDMVRHFDTPSVIAWAREHAVSLEHKLGQHGQFREDVGT